MAAFRSDIQEMQPGCRSIRVVLDPGKRFLDKTLAGLKLEETTLSDLETLIPLLKASSRTF